MESYNTKIEKLRERKNNAKTKKQREYYLRKIIALTLEGKSI
jgi:hypothetical protein